MLTRDFIALATGNGVLCGVRMKKDRAQWAAAGDGEWPLASFVEETGGASGTVQTAEADRPLARVLAAAAHKLGHADLVITLPDEQILCQVLKVPRAAKDDLPDLVALQIDKLSPFPGEELAIGYEVLGETEEDCIVFAAAVPEALTDEWDAALTAVKLKSVRIDVGLLAWWRGLCKPFDLTRPGRHAILLNDGGGWDLLILDHGLPVLARAIGHVPSPVDLARELTLSFLNVELTFGYHPPLELLVLEPLPVETTDTPAPATPLDAGAIALLAEAIGCAVRREGLPPALFCAKGAADRSVEEGVIDLTPKKWRQRAADAAARQRLFLGAGLGGAVWALLAGFLFFAPVGCQKMTRHVGKQSAAISAQYKSATDVRDRVRLIRAYMDRDLAAIELLRKVTSVQPGGVMLTSFTYRREEGLRLSGEADDPAQVYAFKDAVTALRRGESQDVLFTTVTLSGPSFEASKRKHRFDLNARLPGGKEP